LLPDVSASRRALLILALADRGDRRVVPAALEATRSDSEPLRRAAFRALKQVGDVTCVPALLDAAVDGNEDVAQAAIETLACIQDDAVDQQVAKLLNQVEGKRRIVLLGLAGRRRTPDVVQTLWQAADDADPVVRVTALTSLGTVMTSAELPRLIARLGASKSGQEADALDKAIRDVGLRSEDRESVAAQLARALPDASPAVQGRILDTLNIVGGATALRAVAQAAQSGNVELQDEASRVLGQWKSADAAPVLLELHHALRDDRLKIRAIRAYIRIARQFDMPADQRASMCRTALQTAERDTDKQLVLEILLRYPSEAMLAIALEAAEDPALKDQALLIAMGMKSADVDRGELGRALAQAGQKPVKLEITKAEYGAGSKSKDVTEILRKHAKNVRIIFLPDSSYNRSFGGDPAPGIPKKLTIHYRIDGQAASVSLSENATVVLPMPR
jgi:HEAT repeat protein